MLHNIPTHVIAGPLGAGKTTLLRTLMKQRPDHERWALLVNEFGQIGLDAALLATGDQGVSIAEVPGGCLCCINGAPFEVGLAQLLRKAKPQRLFIEPSGLGHPLQLMEQLKRAPWQSVLAVQPLVMVLDAPWLARHQSLPPAQQAALAYAALIIMNKAGAVDDATRLGITDGLTTGAVQWSDCDAVSLEMLPQLPAVTQLAVDSFSQLPVGRAPAALWTNSELPLVAIQDQPEAWSIGWRWHPSQVFATDALEQWLQELTYRRAKLVIHSSAGWVSANGVDNSQGPWKVSEWRRDSRIELIFEVAQNVAALRAQLDACRV